jgi:hypothetical protein
VAAARESAEDVLATVFLGSGLLFVGMLFVAAAVAGATIAAAPSARPGPAVLILSRNLTGSLLNVYSMLMAAVFTLTTVNIGAERLLHHHPVARGPPRGRDPLSERMKDWCA